MSALIGESVMCASGMCGEEVEGGEVGGQNGGRLGYGSGLSYRDGQGAPGLGLSGVGPVRVGRTALWKHGRKTSWCVRLSRGGGGGGGGGCLQRPGN